jgi:SNF2 family DNA or RNA helicase
MVIDITKQDNLTSCRHQKRALHFMHRHEQVNEVLSLRKDLFHILGIPWVRALLRIAPRILSIFHRMSEKSLMPCTGGILADVMGLGKSLSVLALISSSLQAASICQSHQGTEPNKFYNIGMFHTRASLIVVTSAREYIHLG